MKQTDCRRIPTWGIALGTICAILLCAVIVLLVLLLRAPKQQAEIQLPETSVTTEETEGSAESETSRKPEELPSSENNAVSQEPLGSGDEETSEENPDGDYDPTYPTTGTSTPWTDPTQPSTTVTVESEESTAPTQSTTTTESVEPPSSSEPDGGFTFED